MYHTNGSLTFVFSCHKSVDVPCYKAISDRKMMKKNYLLLVVGNDAGGGKHCTRCCNQVKSVTTVITKGTHSLRSLVSRLL